MIKEDNHSIPSYELYLADMPSAGFEYYRSAPNFIFCTECGCRVKNWQRAAQAGTVRNKHKISRTSDGVIILSSKSRGIFDELFGNQVSFRQLYDNQFELKVKNKLRIVYWSDTSKFKTCGSCGSNWSDIFERCFFHNIEELAEPSIFESETHFGTGRLKCPAIIVKGEFVNYLQEHLDTMSFRKINYEFA